MAYGGGSGPGGSGGGPAGSGSGYRRVGEDRTANLKVNNITNRTGDSGTEVDGVVEAKGTHFVPPSGTTEERGSRGRAIRAGGVVPGSRTNVMDYFTIATLGNARNFGDLTSATAQGGGCSSSTRGIFGGTTPDGSTDTNNIEYITISSTGSAFDFGDFTKVGLGRRGASNDTRGIFFGRGDNPLVFKDITYITIATKANAADFGELSAGSSSGASLANNTRGIHAIRSNSSNVIDYITISTTGNAQDFGDYHTANVAITNGLSSPTRGVFSGGYIPSASTNEMSYVTISTLGNTKDFGDLTVAYNEQGATSTHIRGVIMGANDTHIEYITIATTGNAADFGDLTQVVSFPMACSDSHGGLG